MEKSRKRLTAVENLRLRYVVACHLLPKYSGGQLELAPLLGLTQPTLSHFLGGTQGTSPKCAAAVAKLLGTTTNDLFGAGWYPSGGEAAALLVAGFPQASTVTADRVQTVELDPRYSEQKDAEDFIAKGGKWSRDDVLRASGVAAHALGADQHPTAAEWVELIMMRLRAGRHADKVNAEAPSVGRQLADDEEAAAKPKLPPRKPRC